MRMRRGMIITTVVLLGLVFTGGAALAQAAYPPGASAECDTSQVAPGGTITCRAGGFAAGTEVIVEVLGNGFSRTVTVTADGEGVAEVTVQIPPEANDGRTTITFEGRDAEGNFLRVAAASFTVQETTARGEGPIPATGANVSNGAILALGVIVLGGALVYGARRRRQHGADLGS